MSGRTSHLGHAADSGSLAGTPTPPFSCSAPAAPSTPDPGTAFFHQPMPRPLNNRFLNVRRYMTHDDGLQCAERFLSTHGQHGHCQLRLLEDFVVLCVLRECGELRKARTHSSWLCVGRGEKVSRCLIWLAWITGEVIPKSVKIDPLPDGHKPLCVRAREVEMPDARTLQYSAPQLDPTNR